MKNDIQAFIESAYGVKKKYLSPVMIKSMPEYLLTEAKSIVEPRRCYDNCYHLATRWNVTYVIGFGIVEGFPIQHAWIKIGDNYYDPTLESHHGSFKETMYYKVEEFDEHDLELDNFISEVDLNSGIGLYPPMIEILGFHPRWEGKIQSFRPNLLD